MRYPTGFDTNPGIPACDPLTEFLGVTKDGAIEYCYLAGA